MVEEVEFDPFEADAHEKRAATAAAVELSLFVRMVSEGQDGSISAAFPAKEPGERSTFESQPAACGWAVVRLRLEQAVRFGH